MKKLNLYHSRRPLFKGMSLLVALLVISILNFSCGGGGGSGSADLPRGENPGGATIVQLLPSSFVVQTNAYIALYAKVLDGNGVPVPNVDVTFTNLSTVGLLDKTSAKTDGQGLARVNLSSSSPGFATILVQINTSAGVVRDRKTVYFSDYLLLWPWPTLTLDVDGDNDGIYNEQSDFTLFEAPNDNQVIIRATVFNEFGQLVQGINVTFGSDSGEVTFPLGATATTNSSGQASIFAQVDPTALRSFTTVINITAEADNGAANMVSLLISPVTISSVSVTASPTKVQVDGKSTVLAVVTTSTGAPVPDGTTVTFTSNCGLFSPQGQMDPPFVQTVDGVAKSTFNAPSDPTTCEIKATAGGKTGSVFITVISPPSPAPEEPPPPALNVIPGDANVGPGGASGGGAATYVISGGTGPYTVVTNYPGITKINGNSPPQTLPAGETQFTVTNTYTCGSSLTVTITVLDSEGSTKTATYKIDCTL